MDFLKSPNFNALKHSALSVHTLLEKKQATLAVAESLTGGLVSYLLTLRPGASRFFVGSIVCYSSLAKIKHLGIPKNLLEKEGVVRSDIALLMAQTVKTKWDSDYALSLTGLAGPDKEAEDPPVGTVFIGFSGPKGDKVKQLFLEKEGLKASLKSRHVIQQKSALLALEFLKSHLSRPS